MKKLIALLLAMLMALGMFAGCSGDQSDATEPSADVSEDTTPAAPSSGKEPVTISWWTYEDEVVTLIFKKWLKKFHAKYDWITIEVTYLPWDTGPERQTIAFDTNNGKNLEAIYEALKFYHSEEGGYFQGTQDASPSGTSILDWVQINPENMHPIDVTNLIERGGPYSVQHARADWGPSYGWYADFRMCWFPQFSSYLGGYITAEEMLDAWEANTNAAIAKYVEENS